MASYGSEAGVEALVPSLGDFDGSSVPTSTQVTAWLEQGYAIINRALATAGYSTPATSGMAVYDELTALNNLYAAAMAARARGLGGFSGEDENRDVVWLREFRDQLDSLASSDLAQLGMSAQTGKKRRRVRTLQLRRIDGYSGTYEGSTDEYDEPSE